VNSATAGQNIGYSDHNQHAYWHFKDINFSPDGTPLPPPDPVDLVIQLNLMIAALPASSGASDDVRSYDLVWILHLVGDAHQPLHAVGRFTAAIPNGDAGGNAESVIPATGETIALHAYWDRIFGGYSSPFGAVFDADGEDGIGRIAVNKIAAQISDPEAWIKESAELAKQFAYAPPVSTGDKRGASDTRVRDKCPQYRPQSGSASGRASGKSDQQCLEVDANLHLALPVSS
jgi:hypothetical protein